MNPSRRLAIAATCLCAGRVAQAGNQPEEGGVEVDISTLAQEELRIVQWDSKPVWILRRSPAMLTLLGSSQLMARLDNPAASTGGPAYTQNIHRSIKPEIFVGIAICPHAGCVPVPRLKPGPRPEDPENWPGGFACPCHFASFDLAGRVFKDKPTRENIEVPRHRYLDDSRILLGRDAET